MHSSLLLQTHDVPVPVHSMAAEGVLCDVQLQNAAQNGDTSSIANALAVSTGGRVDSVANANSQAFATESSAISDAVSKAVANVRSPSHECTPQSQASMKSCAEYPDARPDGVTHAASNSLCITTSINDP